ncbi:MAG: hypothetical protein MUD14_18905 [Hydrococcus sp. Prado102]|jgi:hypothetical protein|nr:hypothetical protein [Hydrococcus sp. Prado102]
MNKKLLILFSVAIIGGFLGGFHFWRGFTSVPNWYRNQASNTIQASDKTDGAIAKKIQLGSQDINQLLSQKISENTQYSKLLQSAKSIKAHLENNTLEIGGVFNPSEIPEANLDETQKAILDKTLQTFPQLKDVDIYVGLVGQPKMENGRLSFDKDSKLRVGKLTLPVNELAPRFGISTEELQQYLDKQIAKLNIQGIRLDRDKITIEKN